MERSLQLGVKRILDVGLAFFGLVIFSPIVAMCAVLIRLDSRGPVFFRLRAAGLNGKGFDQWKLRTMVEGARERGDRFETSSSDPRTSCSQSRS